jgi:hypothetical protein
MARSSPHAARGVALADQWSYNGDMDGEERADEDLVPVKLSPGYVSLDGEHWYEVPEGMTGPEFMLSLLKSPGQASDS